MHKKTFRMYEQNQDLNLKKFFFCCFFVFTQKRNNLAVMFNSIHLCSVAIRLIILKIYKFSRNYKWYKTEAKNLRVNMRKFILFTTYFFSHETI